MGTLRTSSSSSRGSTTARPSTPTSSGSAPVPFRAAGSVQCLRTSPSSAPAGTARLERIEASAPLTLLTYAAGGSVPTDAVTFRHSRLFGPIRLRTNGTDAGTQVILDHVRVVAPGEATVVNLSDGAIHALHSTLEGEAVSNTGSGSIVCRFTTDESLTTYTSACP